MSLQSALNNSAIKQLDRVYALIKSANQFNADQMTNMALREINNATFSLDNMSVEQKNRLQHKLIKCFKYFRWV